MLLYIYIFKKRFKKLFLWHKILPSHHVTNLCDTYSKQEVTFQRNDYKSVATTSCNFCIVIMIRTVIHTESYILCELYRLHNSAMV